MVLRCTKVTPQNKSAGQEAAWKTTIWNYEEDPTQLFKHTRAWPNFYLFFWEVSSSFFHQKMSSITSHTRVFGSLAEPLDPWLSGSKHHLQNSLFPAACPKPCLPCKGLTDGAVPIPSILCSVFSMPGQKMCFLRWKANQLDVWDGIMERCLQGALLFFFCSQ